MTDNEYFDLMKDLLKYNYRISGADRRLFMKTITDVPGALEQAKALFGDKGTYYVNNSDLHKFIKDVNRGKIVAEKGDQKGFKNIINKNDYKVDYRAKKDVYEVKDTRQFQKNSK